MKSLFRLIKISYLLMFLFIITAPLKSQEGIPYIVNFKLEDRYNLQNWSIIQDDNHIMYFANRKGILTFNGIKWEMIEMPSFPLTMYTHPVYKTVFVGCNNNIGYLSKNNKGNYKFNSILKDTINVGFVIEVIAYNGELIVISEEYISVFNLDGYDLIKQIPIINGFSYNNIIQCNDNVFITNVNNELFLYDNDSLSFSAFKGLSEKGLVLFDLPYLNNKTLLGTSNNKILVFDGKSLTELKIKDQKYLSESILLNGILLSDSSFALSTLIGGVLVIHKKTGETMFTISYANGLPDDEIFSLGKDAHNGLWLSHGLGISRVDFSLPIRQFNAYKGIEGYLLSVINNNNTIYVGTSESVFYLSEIKDYAEKEIIVKVPPQAKQTEVQKVTIETKEESIESPSEDKKKKKKSFWDIFSKPKDEEDSQAKVSKKDEQAANLKKKRSELTVKKKKILEIQSVSHKYIKIQGLDDKCKQLVPFKDRILVAGNNGLYEISNNKAKTIIPEKYIHVIQPSQSDPNKILIGTSSGLLILTYNKTWKVQDIEGLRNESIYSAFEKDSLIWIGTDNYIMLFNSESNEVNYYPIPNSDSDPVLIQEIDYQILAFLPSGVLKYRLSLDSFVIDDRFTKNIENDYSYINSQGKVFWLNKDNEWDILKSPQGFNKQNKIYLNLFERIKNIHIDNNKNIWVIDGDNKLSKIVYNDSNLYNPQLFVYINEITNQEGVEFKIENLVLNYKNNSLKISLAAPFYIKEHAIQYQYFVDGLMKKWSDWSSSSTIDFPYIPPGDYVLHIRAKNVLGNVSSEQSVSFVIKKPFWQRVWFYIICFILFVIVVLYIMKLRERKLQKDKEILEQKVKERTATIEQQKKEIEGQRDALAERNAEIEAQKDHIAKQNEEITHSIQYAKRIQTAVLPAVEAMDRALPDYFVLFRPRDIVSGDFYWMAEKDNRVILVAADCTGHGVPGAFMSMLGVSFLNEIVNKGNISQANKILNQLRGNVKNTLSQTGKEGEAKDGMDIALLIFDFKSYSVQYAGAYNPLYLVRNGELFETKADKMPIGIHISEKDSFTNNEIKLKKGDTLYIFSDGFIDQFGGDAGRKFMAKPFKELLIEIQKSPMDEQRFILNETLDAWRGNYNQVDDIIIIGIRVH